MNDVCIFQGLTNPEDKKWYWGYLADMWGVDTRGPFDSLKDCVENLLIAEKEGDG